MQQMKQPLVIRILTWFAALASAGMFLSILLAICDIGPSIMGGERVTRSEWLHIAVPVVAVIGILMACSAYGFHAHRPWSRHLVVAMFGLIVVYAASLGALNVLRYTIMWRAIINGSVFGGASVWYFYLKPNVAAYFRELSEQ
jgi:threonine/homoserine efflux transporter RhtA